LSGNYTDVELMKLLQDNKITNVSEPDGYTASDIEEWGEAMADAWYNDPENQDSREELLAYEDSLDLVYTCCRAQFTDCYNTTGWWQRSASAVIADEMSLVSWTNTRQSIVWRKCKESVNVARCNTATARSQ
jgi:hypothetical protein